MLTRYRCGSLGIVTLVAAAIVAALSLTAMAAEFLELPDGSKLDLSQKCPVCGMAIGGKEGQAVTVSFEDGRVVGFKAVAAAVFKDGHVVGFEGARCLFVYNSVPQKHEVDIKDIARQFVTDFVSKKMIDLSEAFLVLGSNTKGPMGYDLIPFAARQDAAAFAAANNGKWIVQLDKMRLAAGEAGKERSLLVPGKAAAIEQPRGKDRTKVRTSTDDLEHAGSSRYSRGHGCGH